MNRRLFAFIIVGLLGVLTPVAVFAQQAATLEDLAAKFSGWTEQDAAAAGYVKDEFCIDSSVIGQPGLGAMGFHAVNPTLMGPTVDPLNPPIVLIDGDGNVVAAEYFAPDVGQPRPTVFGEPFEGPMPGHGPDQPVHYDLHVWLIDNPSGQFAGFNPSLSCPAGSLPPPTPVLISAPATGDVPLPWLYIMLAGGSLMLAGLGLRRWATRNVDR